MENQKRSRRFTASFWEKDITSTEGFDRLQKHMKEGKITCEVAEKLIKARAKAEEDYARALMKISKSSGETPEIGTVKNSLDCLKNEVEKMAQASLDSVAQLNEISAKISNFHKEQKLSRKNLEDAISSHSKDMSNLYKKTTESKKLYHIKSQEAENATEARLKANHDKNCSEKDFEKISSRCNEAQQVAARAERDYRALVSKLRDIQLSWNNEMTDYCKVCDNLEEKRLDFLREQLWQSCNVISINSVEIDGKCEVVRNSLENVNIDSDITNFVDRASTGSEPPDHIRFEPFNGSDGKA